VRIQVNVTVTDSYSWEKRAESEAEVKIEFGAETLPWEQICASLVQKAIKEYMELCEKEEEETDE